MTHQQIIELPDKAKIITHPGHIVPGSRLEEPIVPTMKANNQPYVYLLAGSAAGISEHCTMYPVDMVKTRMQSLRPHPNAVYRGLKHAFFEIKKTEGLRRTMRGFPVVFCGAGPAHALYFTSYEYTKKLLHGRLYGGEHTLHAVSAAVATFFHDGTMNPVEVIKQRIQIYNSPYKGVFECARNILKTEGITAFYRSFSTTLAMNLPFQCLHFVTYEFLKKTLNPHDEYMIRVHLFSGGAAGGVAAALTSPFDVAKTLLNTQEKCVLMECKTDKNKHLRGMWNALRTIYTMHGFRGYFRGVQARILFQIPSTAVSWCVYEFFKHKLSLQISEEEMFELTL